MNQHYFLIDYENIQPREIPQFEGVSVQFLVFIGENQPKIRLTFAQQLQRLGSNVEYVQISGSGKNALDFHIAYTLGRLSEKDPSGVYYIISNDKGFDPLIKFANERKIQVKRLQTIPNIPIPRKPIPSTLDERVGFIIRNLDSRATGRPKRVDRLKNTIGALLQNKPSPSELDGLIRALTKRRYISVEGEMVAYRPIVLS